jgi:hypothetical protein
LNKHKERVQGSEFRVQGSGFRVQGSEFRVQSSEFLVCSFWFLFLDSGNTQPDNKAQTNNKPSQSSN